MKRQKALKWFSDSDELWWQTVTDEDPEGETDYKTLMQMNMGPWRLDEMLVTRSAQKDKELEDILLGSGK